MGPHMYGANPLNQWGCFPVAPTGAAHLSGDTRTVCVPRANHVPAGQSLSGTPGTPPSALQAATFAGSDSMRWSPATEPGSARA
jgi:hypothetical protein